MPQAKASSPGEAVGTDKDKEALKRQECKEVMKKATKAAFPTYTLEQDDPGKKLAPRQKQQQWEEVVKTIIKRQSQRQQEHRKQQQKLEVEMQPPRAASLKGRRKELREVCQRKHWKLYSPNLSLLRQLFKSH